MKRPLRLGLLSDHLKVRAFYKLYNHRQDKFAPLFRRAPLRFAEGTHLYDLLPGDVISGSIALIGFYELELTRRIVELSRDGGLFVDVGANLGYFSVLWAAAGENSRVICFEASPRNIGLLENNVEQNALSDRISVIPKAAGREVGTISFEVGDAAQTGWGGIAVGATNSAIEVPMTTVDDEVPNGIVDVLKIDVEGADTWVLMGCQRLLQEQRIRFIFFEQNPIRMKELGIEQGEAQTLLADLGYTCQPLDAGGIEWQASPAQAGE